MYVEKEIDGKTYNFELIFNTENTGPTAVNTMMYNPTTLVTERMEDTYYPVDEYPIPDPAPGYAIPWGTTSWITMEKWAWMNGLDLGWRSINIQYESGEIVYSNKTPSIEIAKGTTEQFSTPDLPAETVTWSIKGNNISGTTIDENGLLTVPADETAESITIYAETPEAFSIGAVNVKLTQSN
ncbi:MAG: hypothetical protein SO016_05605 [Lachnospiraceae bacterium]|nr:hypothetical protein [Lachnospiraceae bacterium]